MVGFNWRPNLQVREGRVLLYLHKVKRQSWYPEMSEGLDAYDEEAEQMALQAVEQKALEELKDQVDQKVFEQKPSGPPDIPMMPSAPMEGIWPT